MAKCFKVVNTLSLIEPFCNEAGFVAIYAAVWFIFQLENPFASYYVTMR